MQLAFAVVRTSLLVEVGRTRHAERPMVRCSRRPTRDRRHAVRRGSFSLQPREGVCLWENGDGARMFSLNFVLADGPRGALDSLHAVRRKPLAQFGELLSLTCEHLELFTTICSPNLYEVGWAPRARKRSHKL
jgi:hypothetical protein